MKKNMPILKGSNIDYSGDKTIPYPLAGKCFFWGGGE